MSKLMQDSRRSDLNWFSRAPTILSAIRPQRHKRRLIWRSFQKISLSRPQMWTSYKFVSSFDVHVVYICRDREGFGQWSVLSSGHAALGWLKFKVLAFTHLRFKSCPCKTCCPAYLKGIHPHTTCFCHLPGLGGSYLGVSGWVWWRPPVLLPWPPRRTEDCSTRHIIAFMLLCSIGSVKTQIKSFSACCQ